MKKREKFRKQKKQNKQKNRKKQKTKKEKKKKKKKKKQNGEEEETKRRRRKKEKQRKKKEKQRKYVPLLLARWMECPRRRWVRRGFGAADSERSVRPESPTSPCQRHSNHMPPQPKGRVGGQRQNHTLPKGSVNHISLWGDMCEEHRRYFLYRLGPAGGTSTMSGKA